MSEADAVVVLSTAPPDVAEGLVDRLLEERLAACVNLVGPVRSRYRWQGKLESATETLLVIKTLRASVPALLARLRELHPYEVPEALVVPIESGLPAYLGWIADSCRA